MSIQRYAPTRYSRIYEACQGGLIKYADHKKVCKEFGKMIQSLKDNDADHKAALAEQGARIAELEEALNKIISLYPNKGGIMRTMAKNVMARGDKEAQS